MLIEGTFGIWFKPYDGSREKVNRRRIQWGPQFSHVDRNTWSGDRRGAARAGWNDSYFVPLLLTVACASLTPAIPLLLRGRAFRRSYEFG